MHDSEKNNFNIAHIALCMSMHVCAIATANVSMNFKKSVSAILCSKKYVLVAKIRFVHVCTNWACSSIVHNVGITCQTSRSQLKS